MLQICSPLSSFRLAAIRSLLFGSSALASPLLVAAQVPECGNCSNTISNVTSFTVGGKTASIVIESNPEGVCVSREGCSQRDPCRLNFRVAVIGLGAGEAPTFSYGGYMVGHDVEYPDVTPEDWVAGGSGQTGTGGQSQSHSIDISCNKLLYFEASILSGKVTAEVSCGACPTVGPGPL